MFFGLIIIVFFIVAVATFYFISKKIGTNDTAKDVASAITTITFANVILVFLMGIISFMFVRNTQILSPTYTIIMLHLTLLFSLTAVSIASIEKFS